MLKDLWDIANKAAGKTLDYIINTVLVLAALGVLVYLLVSCTN